MFTFSYFLSVWQIPRDAQFSQPHPHVLFTLHSLFILKITIDNKITLIKIVPPF